MPLYALKFVRDNCRCPILTVAIQSLVIDDYYANCQLKGFTRATYILFLSCFDSHGRFVVEWYCFHALFCSLLDQFVNSFARANVLLTIRI